MSKAVWVRLQVGPEAYAFARAHYREKGYFSPKDYLNAVLNTAMLEELDSVEQADPLVPKPPE